MNGKTATVHFFKKHSYNVAEATQELPVAGTLRLYGEHGQYKDIPWSVGSVITFGNEDQDEYTNLNTATSIAYKWFECTNIRIPAGITFENASKFSYAFYGANNITFPSGCKRLGTINDYAYKKAKNIVFDEKVYLTGSCTGTFSEIDGTVEFRDGIDFTGATSLLDTFYGAPHFKNQDIDLYLPLVTDLRNCFRTCTPKSMKIVAPECLYCGNVGAQIYTANEFYLDAQKCVNVNTGGSYSSNWGVCGGGHYRKVTTILPKVTDGYYICQNTSSDLAGWMTEWYGDLSGMTSAVGAFHQCALDAPSVHRLQETLKSFTSGSHPITIGVDGTLINDEGVLADLDAIRNKGWTLTLQWVSKHA